MANGKVVNDVAIKINQLGAKMNAMHKERKESFMTSNNFYGQRFIKGDVVKLFCFDNAKFVVEEDLDWQFFMDSYGNPHNKGMVKEYHRTSLWSWLVWLFGKK